MPVPSAARLHEFIVVINEPVACDMWRLVIRASKLAQTIKPGQFESFYVPGDPSQIVRIPLSFSAVDKREGTLETIYAVVGDGTRRLSHMKPGDTSNVLGPCGHGWRVENGASPILLVAGGVGVTPILGLARELGSQNIAFDVVLGARDKARCWGEAEFIDAGARNVVVTTDDGSYGIAGYASDGVKKLLADTSYRCLYVCGPEPMMASVAQISHENELDCQVSLERMMTCGFGVCATCNVALAQGGYASACMDGPVFSAEEVLW